MELEKLEKDVFTFIKENNLIEKNDNLILAISGGADSIFMLYVLNNINQEYNLNLNFVICHLNHMIREEAKEDVEYVKEVSNKLNILFFSKDVDILKIVKESKRSEEEIGRIERYKFFNEIGIQEFEKNNFKVCVAHNLNDNTETVFLNLIRGTGIEGLKGIEVKNNNVIRPILFVKREKIEEYLNNKNIKYIIDKTNLSSDYTRNSIRNEILPIIKEKFNPNIDETIYRTSDILRDEDLLLENITKYMLEDLIINKEEILKEQKQQKQEIEKEKKNNKIKIELDLKKFNELDIALRRRVLKYILKIYFDTYKNISKINIDDAIKLIYNNIGNKYTMLNKNIKVEVNKGIITIINY